MKNVRRWMLNLSLWPRMALTISLGFLALFAAFSALSERALQDNTDRILNERLIMAQMTASQLDGLLQEASFELQRSLHLTNLDPIDSDLLAQAEVLAYAYDLSGELTAGLVLLDSNGQVILSHPPGLYRSGTDLSGLPYVAQALARRDVIISEPFHDPLNQRPVVAVTISIYDGDRLLGLLSGLVDLEGAMIAPLQQAATLGDASHATLIDSQGRSLVSTFDLPFLSVGEHATFYRQAAATGRPVVETVPFELDLPNEPEGHLHLIAFAPLENAPWGVAVGGDLVGGPFAEVQRLRFGLAVLGFVALTIVGGITLVGTRRLMRSVQHLTEAAQQIAQGDLHTPLYTIEGGEIGAMATALERMRTQLLANIEELANWNETLTARVAVQSEELSQQQTILANMDQTIRTPLTLDEMLEQILTQTRKIGQVTQGAIFLHDRVTERLRPVVVQGIGPEQLDELGTLASQIVARRQPLHISESPARGNQSGGAVRAASVLAIPLTLDEAVLGVFLLADPRPQAFSKRQVTLLSTIASQIAFIVRNGQLYACLESQAIQAERNWLARETHDGLVQTLGYFKLQLNRMQGWTQAGDLARLEREVADLREVLEDAYSEARDAIAGLRVGLNPGDTLESVLAEYVPSFSARYRLPVELTVDGDSAISLQPAVILHLLRIVQEGLTNVRKHGRASQAWVKVYHHQSDGLVLTISDDGQGLDPQVMDQGDLRGLQYMRERVESVGGQLAIYARHPQGTEIRVTVRDPNRTQPERNEKMDVLSGIGRSMIHTCLMCIRMRGKLAALSATGGQEEIATMTDNLPPASLSPPDQRASNDPVAKGSSDPGQDDAARRSDPL